MTTEYLNDADKKRTAKYLAYLKCTHQHGSSLMSQIDSLTIHELMQPGHLQNPVDNQELLELLRTKFFVETNASPLPYGVFPVDLCLRTKDSGKVKAYVNLTDCGVDVESGERSKQLKKFLYASVSQHTPLLSVNSEEVKKLAKKL